MVKNNNQSRITLCGILMAVYFAIFPIHQTLVLSNGSTINKYISFAIILLLFLRQIGSGALFTPDNHVAKPLIAMTVFLVISVIWASSKSATISSVISLVSYIALTILACDTEWTVKEKRLFLLVMMIACTYYGITMFVAQGTGVVGEGSVFRSTYSGINGVEADQNLLAINISMGAIIAIRLYLLERRIIVKYFALTCAGIILLGVVSTGSRGGLLSFVAGVFIILKYGGTSSQQRSRIFVLFILVIIAAVVIFSGRTSIQSDVINRFISEDELSGGSGRIEIWGQYLNIMLHKPYAIPFGFGTSGAAYSSYYGNNWPPATHNDVVDQFLSGGLILVYLVYRYVNIVWRKAKAENNLVGMACMIVALVGGLTVNGFTRYGWWSAMIIGYIGMDWQLTEKVSYDE